MRVTEDIGGLVRRESIVDNAAMGVVLGLCLQETELCLGVAQRRKEWIGRRPMRSRSGGRLGKSVIDNERD